MHVILYTLATCVCIYTLADFYFMIRQVIFLSVLSAFGLKTEPYHSSDPQVRLAKQRLLSMNPDSPGIRFRTGTQMTDLVDVDSSVTNLQGSVSKFSDSLSQVAGIIDVTRVNNGLVPQMQALVGQIKALDSKLLSTHRRTAKQISSLYMQATAIPTQLTANLQRSVDSLVQSYNQQIVNQVAALERQRNRAISQAVSDSNMLSRTVQGVQLSQIVSAKKLIKQIQSSRTDILSKSVDLANKFNVAMAIVKNALAGVKTQSQADLVTVGNIVNANKKALVEYITQSGNTWTTSFQNLIAKSASMSAKALASMSSNLSNNLNDAKKKSVAELAQVDATVDAAVGQVGRQIATVSRQFDLAIQNATRSTDTVVAAVKQPVQDVQDQVQAASALLHSLQSQTSLAVTGVAASATKSSQALLDKYRRGGQSIESNPGFAAVSAGITNVYNQATSDIATAQTGAEVRVGGMQNQLGANDQTVGQISQTLQSGIDAQKTEFAQKTQLATATLSANIDASASKLADLASQNAAQVDDLKANSDDQIANIIDSLGSKIGNVHDSASALIDAAYAKVVASSSDVNALVAQTFGGVLADGAAVQSGATDLAAATAATGAQISTINAALANQTAFVNRNMQDAIGQIADLKQLGSNSVDQFYQQSRSNTASAVGDFSKQSAAAVDAFGQSVSGQYASLVSAQGALKSAQAQSAQAAAAAQAGLSANLTNAQQLLASVKASTSQTSAQVANTASSLLAQFKSGSVSEVADLKQGVSDRMRAISAELNARVLAAGDSVSNQTKGFLTNLAQMSKYLSDNSNQLKSTLSNTTSAVGDFQQMANSLANQINLLSSGLKLFVSNSTNYINDKVTSAAEFLNDTRDDTLDQIDATVKNLETAMNGVDGSTAQKIDQFKQSVNDSIHNSDTIIRNFTNYIDAMVDYEKKSADARIAVQRGLLQSLMSQAISSADNGNAGRSSEMLDRLRAVLATASDSATASADSVAAQKTAQDTLINQFGIDTASQVSGLLNSLNSNQANFVAGVSNASAASAADSAALLSGTDLGVAGVVGLAGDVAGSVESALNGTTAQLRESQLAMAALRAESNDLLNLTQSQISAVLEAMMDSQAMYASRLAEAKGNNSADIAQISGVVQDFVLLVNETLNQSNDLISTVDANYSDASMKLGSKMDTVIGYITRESNKVASSADNSAQALKTLLLTSGPIQDGIRETLKSLSDQQDKFATDVHSQLATLSARLADDTNKMTSARAAATNKLYDSLHHASETFAANAAAWQNQKLGALIQTKDVTTMTDQELVQDALLHLAKTA